MVIIIMPIHAGILSEYFIQKTVSGYLSENVKALLSLYRQRIF